MSEVASADPLTVPPPATQAANAGGRALPRSAGRSRQAELSDVAATVLAAATWVGARHALALPAVVVALVVLATLVLRRPRLLIVATALLASALAARAEAGLVAPHPGPWRGTVVLLTDPEPIAGGMRADVRADRRHLRLEARGRAAGALREAWAGKHLAVVGRVGSLRQGSAALRVRHLAGLLRATTAEVTPGERPWWRWAHTARQRIEAVADPLPVDERALFDGFVLGDTREQSAEVASDFRAAGLTHLLVVSGENVAMLLTLVGPLLRRRGWGARWACTIVLLGGFALLTRFEPSVLRAVAMAAIATTASARGRPAGAWRSLALAVTGLLLVDPFLARSVGFVLSVSASAGILAGARPLAELIPGPRPIADVLGVTAAAQLGVAPVIVATFGGLPVAALPANLAAAPAAAAVVVVGLPLLTVAAVLHALAVPATLVTTLRSPARVLLDSILFVARWGARLPLGSAGARVVAAVAIGVGLAILADHRGWVGWGRAGRGLVVVALLAPALAVRLAPASGVLLPGVTLDRHGGATVVVVDANASVDDLLERLASRGVRRIDLLVLTRGGARDAEVARGLSHRWDVQRLLAPRGHRVRGATTAHPGQVWTVGDLRVALRGPPRRLRVTVTDPSGTALSGGG